MPTNTDIVNLALQRIGTRTTVTASELANNSTNEAIQANLALTDTRDELLRMAPWNCGKNYMNLVLITAAPGTPENPTAGTSTWQKGQPAPPWSYEYQYPVFPIRCIKPCFIVPQWTTGAAGGIPITPAITGMVPTYWNGPPARFNVAVDQFYAIETVVIANAGTGYAVGDYIFLDTTPAAGATPIGAGGVLQVATVGGSGNILTLATFDQFTMGGNYIRIPSNPATQASTSGSGTGATFTLTFSAQQGDRRVILTNQAEAILAFVKQVTDPNVMDEAFIDAWISALGGKLALPLTGDKALANMKLQEANVAVMEARTSDGNEGLTVNDVTPDWIRARGIDFANGVGWTPNFGVDWGSLFPLYS